MTPAGPDGRWERDGPQNGDEIGTAVTQLPMVLVLGMHKSGTSLVSETLHRSGISMGQVNEGSDYDKGGTWECRRAQDLNRRLLNGLAVPIPDLRFWKQTNDGLDDAGYPRNDDAVSVFRSARASRQWADGPLDAELASYVADRAGRDDRWGFKDPRTCLTLSRWTPHLPADFAAVIVYRDPAQVLDHLLYTRGHRGPVTGTTRAWAALRSWTIHNLTCMALAADLPADRCLALRYDELMSDDDELDRLAAFLDTDLIDARRPGLYRKREATERSQDRVRQLGRLVRPSPETVMADLDSLRGRGASHLADGAATAAPVEHGQRAGDGDVE